MHTRGEWGQVWEHIKISDYEKYAAEFCPEENAIPGLRGQLSFFYVKDLTIRDLICPDLGSYGFCIQICTFENAIIENVHIEGKKDDSISVGAKIS